MSLYQLLTERPLRSPVLMLATETWLDAATERSSA